MIKSGANTGVVGVLQFQCLRSAVSSPRLFKIKAELQKKEATAVQ